MKRVRISGGALALGAALYSMLAFSTGVLADERALLAQSAAGTLAAAAAGDPALSGRLDRLRVRAEERGRVRLLVGVRAAFVPEGELSGEDVEKQRLDIGRKQDAVLHRLAAAHGANGKPVRFAAIPFLALEASAAEFQTLIADIDVLSVEEDALRAPALSESSPLIGAVGASVAGYSGSGQAVAVLDTGVDKTHPFLSGKVIDEACFSSTVAAATSSSVCPGGVNESTASGSGVDCGAGCEHGTHVAGIAAGFGGSFSGVARGANLVSIQVFSRFSSPEVCGGAAPCLLSYSSDQIKALERVLVQRTVDRIAAANLSLGGGRYGSEAACDADNLAFKAAVDNLRSTGVATVISSGNNAFLDSLSAPGCVSSAISVGATWDEGGWIGGCEATFTTVDKVACYSNSASFLKLLAPGSAINSSIPGTGYAIFHGTSMAAPQISGAFAVLRQAVPDLSVDNAYNALRSSGVPVRDYRNNLVKPRVDLDGALVALGVDIDSVQFERAAYATGEGATAILNVLRSGDLRKTSTVGYATVAQSASAGVDYVGTSGTLTFAAGQSVQTIGVPTLADSLVEGDETFLVQLSNPGAGTATGAISAATVTISDAGPPDAFGSSIPRGWKKPRGAESIWVVANDSASEGRYSLKSAPTGNGQESGIEYTASFNAGTVRFDYRVSSETGDYLRFHIDGVKQAEWSGEAPWAAYAVNLSAGRHTLRWLYEKNGALSGGADAAWIDNVQLPPAKTSPGRK